MTERTHLTRLIYSKAEVSKQLEPKIQNTPPLPQVDWAAIGASAPQLLATPAGGLPNADAIVITWADAEWAAAEHVFCNSAASAPYSSRNTGSWSQWIKYASGVPSVPNQPDWNYWGYYRLVKVGNANVLLFKSNTHLDYPGGQYLSQLIGEFIKSVKPKLILSIGTAGGARTSDHVGTINVVHSGTLYESNAAQSAWPDYSNTWSASWSVIQKPGFAKLLFPVPTTSSDLQTVASQFNAHYGTSYSLDQLNVNNLNMADPTPALNNLTAAGTPLLTTNSFLVANSAGNLKAFACVEMDDAIIAKACGTKTAFGFVRNISDPVQNVALPAKVQGDWGSAIYSAYGIYTSYNGAITAWAILAGQF